VVQRATARSTLDGLLSDEPPAAGIIALGQRNDTMYELARAKRSSRRSSVPPIATVLKRLRGNHVLTYFRARGELWAIAVSSDSSLQARKIGDATAIAAQPTELRKHPEDAAIADELGAVLLPDEDMPPAEAQMHIVADDPISNVSFEVQRAEHSRISAPRR
jgi:hypothetical protein